jgi:GDP-4-dehydro-6-deoxy-D-mannose reductase
MAHSTVLITGANGFVGKNLYQHLLSESPKDKVYTTGLHPVSPARDTHVVANLTDEDSVQKLILKTRPDCVYHLAGAARISNQISFEEYFQSNTLTTLILLKSLALLEKPVRFFFSSSMHVYGNPTELVDETTPAHPLSPYAFSKFLAEEAIKQATHENKNLRAIIGRLYNCFGPGQAEGYVAADLCRKILDLPDKKDAVLSTGPLQSYRRFTDVRDAIQIFPRILNTDFAARVEIFNIASHYELRVKDLVDILLKVSGKTARVESKESTGNVFQGIKLNLKKLEQYFPVDSFRPIEETLRDMLKGE